MLIKLCVFFRVSVIAVKTKKRALGATNEVHLIVQLSIKVKCLDEKVLIAFRSNFMR